MSKNRLGGMGKLSDFGQTQKTQAAAPAEPSVSPKVKAVSNPAIAEQEKLTTVNIKITRTQQEWLADTARLVRDNNDEPVPPSDRVYPQHLIQAAIDLLKTADVDWEQVRNIEDLKKHLSA